MHGEMGLNFRLSALVVFLASLPLSGCLFRTRRVEQNLSPVALRTATKLELMAYIKQTAQIQTLRATVDIGTEVGGAKKGKITEYTEIRGYILARKPTMLRMIGLLPIVRNRAFDMVSDGREFKVWIPPKNRFIIGRNDLVTPNPQQPLEDLRPQVVNDALLLREIDPRTETVVLDQSSTETVTGDKGRKFEQPVYVIEVIRGKGLNEVLSRKIVFNRENLLPDRQLIYDDSGTVVTDARYSDYKDYNAVLFPSRIEIKRPEEEFDITLNIVELDINQPLSNDKFVLDEPPGVQVFHLDRLQTIPNGGGD
jgi:outer membrane lipoprotein-sorting protein